MRTCWRNTPNSHTSRRLRYSSKLYMAFWWIKWTIDYLVFYVLLTSVWQEQRVFLFCRAFRKPLGSTHPLLQGVPGSLLPEKSVQGMKLTIYLHLMPRLGMSEAIPHLHNMTVSRDNFTFTKSCESGIFSGCKTH